MRDGGILSGRPPTSDRLRGQLAGTPTAGRVSRGSQRSVPVGTALYVVPTCVRFRKSLADHTGLSHPVHAGEARPAALAEIDGRLLSVFLVELAPKPLFPRLL